MGSTSSWPTRGPVRSRGSWSAQTLTAHFDALRFIDSAGDWSPDGTQFVFAVFADGDNELAIVNVENGDVERKIKLDGIGAITSPAWSPDGQFIAFSGLDGGVSDIYTWDVVTGALTQLTDDKHADLQPTWSPDGSTIAFVSDRGAITDFKNLVYSKPQIAFLDVASRRVTTLSVFGEVKHINPQYAPDGRSLYFVSDQDGFSDIYQYTFASQRCPSYHAAADRRERNHRDVADVFCGSRGRNASLHCLRRRPVPRLQPSGRRGRRGGRSGRRVLHTAAGPSSPAGGAGAVEPDRRLPGRSDHGPRTDRNLSRRERGRVRFLALPRLPGATQHRRRH